MDRISINMFNEITKVKVIPCDVDQYYYVTKLAVKYCRVSILPIELFNQNLQILDLQYNTIQTLPREIKNLSNLTYLNISGNNIEMNRININMHRAITKVEVMPYDVNQYYYVANLVVIYYQVSIFVNKTV